MSAASDSRLELIVEQALELDPSERDRFLDAHCESDPTLRAELERLLQADTPDGRSLKDLFQSIRNEMRHRVEIPTGARLLDRFTVLGKIGSGGMADVYLVREDDFDRELALKVIRHGLQESESNRQRFLNEAKLLGLLQNQNIVPVHRMGELEDGRPYYAMRYVRGVSLMDAIKRFHNLHGAASDPREVVLALHGLLRRFVDVCNAVAYAHSQGVMHRDIKPANIVLGDDGEYGESFLVDWGLAKLLAPENSISVDVGGSIRTRRWMGRHRTLVVSGAAVLAFSLTGLVGFAMVLASKNHELNTRNRELDRERLEVVEQRDRALKAEQAAQDEEAKAKKSESESRVVIDFFENRVLAAARPKDWEGGLGGDATISAALDAAEPRIQNSFADQPEVEASIRNTLGQSYLYLGDPAIAIRQFERAEAVRRQFLGPVHRDTLRAMNNLAYAYRDAGRFPDALPLLDDTVKKCKANLGSDDSDTLNAMNNLAGVYREVDRMDDALRLNEETLRRRKATLGLDHTDTLASMSYVARTYGSAGRFDDALPLYEETLKRRRAKLGPAHADTLLTMNDLATAYFRASRVADALPLFEETLKQRRLKLGSDHPGTLITMDNLATVYREADRLSEALRLHEEALKGLKARLSQEHPDTLITMNNLIAAYLDAKKWSDAESTSRECLATREKKAPDDWWRFHTMSQLGAALAGQKRYLESEPLILQGYEGLKARAKRIPVSRKRSLTEASARIISLYDAWGKRDKVDELGRKPDAEMADKNFPMNPFAP